MATTRRPRPQAPRILPKPAPAGPASVLTGDDPPCPADAVEVARVLGAWGVKGGIKLKPFSSDPQALFSSKRWWVEPAEASLPGVAGAARPPVPRLLRVLQAREQGETVVATAQELPDRNAAEALTGARIFVSRASFPSTDEGEYYWVDLIGLSVRNRQGLNLGTVDHLIETGPHCVLAVQPPAGDGPPAQPLLIPFVGAYVDRVDREARLIEVDWDPAY